MNKFIIITIFIVICHGLFAAYFEALPTYLEQPDGEEIFCYSSGDEYYNWLHDALGYVIIQNGSDGFYYYAIQDGEDVKPSIYKFGSSEPATLGLKPKIHKSSRLIQKQIDFFADPMREEIAPIRRGTLNNIVVYIRFADQTEFPDPRSIFEIRFNSENPEDISLKGYYNEVSYGQLELNSFHYPECDMNISLSYQDQHTRDYFLPISLTNPDGYEYWERTEREHQLLADAIDFISNEIPEDLDIDYNDDGYVDNVCFVIRGVHSAWSDLLWAHRWALYSEYASINGLQVYDYTFQPENQNNVRTLAHEMFHALGAPDLYHYQFDGISPAGPWDIMESGFVNMGAHMKTKYGGWINEIPIIEMSGFYSLNPLNNPDNNCYRINSPYSTNEYFVLEYRKRDLNTYERNVPGSGLLVTRIHENLDGNADGPPDEVYYFRPDGDLTSNGSIYNAYFSEDMERIAINDFTNPSSFLNNGDDGGLNIHSIGVAGDQIEFYVDLDTGNVPPVVSFLTPTSDAFLPVSNILIDIEASTVTGSIVNVELFLDDESIAVLYDSPYQFTWNTEEENIGYHHLKAIATSDNALQGIALASINIIDPQQDNWFSWYTSEPVYDSFGRGSIPIKAAVDFDLGDQDYYVKKVSLNIQPDSYGEADVPGLVHCSIIEVNDSGLTGNVLMDLGEFITPMDGRFIESINSTETITGKVALVMDIDCYQNILFDTNGITGHSWLTEPDRPWVDAISRGMIGSADIAMEISTNFTDSDEDLVIPVYSGLIGNYPNPFNPQTSIKFFLTEAEKIVEINIFNIKGQLVNSLEKKDVKAGINSIQWNGIDNKGNPVTSGVYFYTLKLKKYNSVKKMILLK